MSGNDTHADTIREALNEGERVLNAVWEQWWRSRSGSSDTSLAHAVANLDLERATEALNALVADLEREREAAANIKRDYDDVFGQLLMSHGDLGRERARADRAEAALAKARAALANGSHDDLGRMGRAFGILDAALSAGSDGPTDEELELDRAGAELGWDGVTTAAERESAGSGGRETTP